MKLVADLHIHSHFSRATSKALDPEHLAQWAQKKGITLVGTGDFTHPGWLSELQDKLIQAEEGLYQLRPDLQKAACSQVPSSCRATTRFLLSGEISCIYKKNGKTRKVHNLVLMPNMTSVLRLNERLRRIGNILSDGRPILGLDSRNLLEIVLEANEKGLLIPAHIWTPWFSVFGSKSGFDCLEECFEDLLGHIHALETGLSSDPPMNRRLSLLDNYVLVSNSDAHSPGKLGREANLFDIPLDYPHLIQAMIDGKGLLGTIEFFPEEGKYHLDGHRKCRVKVHPEETRKLQEICPVCGRHLTVGVLHRVDDLADRDTPKLSKDFFSLIPLPEVLAEILNCGPSTKKVLSFYEMLLSALGPELKILMETPLIDIEASGGPVLAEAVKRMRQNQVIREGGYDGQFGIIRLFEHSERQAVAGQMTLFSCPREEITKQSDLDLPLIKVPVKRKTETTKGFLLPLDPILGPLNPEQRSAVLYEGGHLLVVAGPGTGKTMTLTHRIAHLIHIGLASTERILALTFTRKAAGEMSQRISTLLEGLALNEVRVATFHGFCLELLRREADNTGLPLDFTLCSELDAEKITKDILAGSRLSTRFTGKFLKLVSTIRRAFVLDFQGGDRDYGLVPIGKDRTSILSGAEAKQNGVLDESHLMPFVEKYQQRLRELGMLDLDDLEVESLRFLRAHPEISKVYGERFPWIFVDEYQDTNSVQAELLKTLVHAASGRICAIGDPDQAIYGFRGADIGNFHRFRQDFPGAKEIVLTRNYRSTEGILRGSASLIGNPKPLQGESWGGDLISFAPCRTESEEAEMVVEQIERLMGGTSYFSLDSGRVSSDEGELSLGFGDIGVLYRLNAQGDALEEAMDRAGIPLVRSGHTPLISIYPANIVWRFFQALQYPDNPYYVKEYETLLSEHRLRDSRSMSYEQFFPRSHGSCPYTS
jgi:DNA helicase-2/ATP-dependent DNA helicase PcrA